MATGRRSVLCRGKGRRLRVPPLFRLFSAVIGGRSFSRSSAPLVTSEKKTSGHAVSSKQNRWPSGFFSAGGAFRRSFVSRWCAHRAAGSGLPLGSADHAGTEAGPDFVFRQKRNAALLRDVFTIRGKRSNIRNPFVRHRIRIDATRSRTCTMRRLNLSDDLYGQSQVLGPASLHVPG